MSIFINRIIGDSEQIQNRDDVNFKKILRAFKAYYETKLNRVYEKNNIKKKIVSKKLYYRDR